MKKQKIILQSFHISFSGGTIGFNIPLKEQPTLVLKEQPHNDEIIEGELILGSKGTSPLKHFRFSEKEGKKVFTCIQLSIPETTKVYFFTEANFTEI